VAHEQTFGSDERELLRRITTKYSPELSDLVDVVGSRPLTDREREELRAGLAREFTSVGLEEDSEPNEYGVEVDDLIGRLMFF
jgi:hypothetical protein